MAVKSLGAYQTKSLSRQELYGDDMLVHVIRRDSILYCSPVAFRVPQNMLWQDFVASQVMPWASADPDFDTVGPHTWKLVEQDFQPEDGRSLIELGVKHKNTISIDVAQVDAGSGREGD